jgi:predicted dehydrogenase
MPKYRVAIVSAGRMAGSIDDEIAQSDAWPSLKAQLPYCHAGCYHALDDTEMVAVCDLDGAKCQSFCQRWGVPRHYQDYREMIQQEKPDLVSVATAASLHAEMAVFAAENKVLGLYCEKAMCCSLAEADRMVAAVRQHHVKFQLGAHRRHNPLFRKARELIESGDFGSLVGVSSWSMGPLLHGICHLVDTALYLAGDSRPLSVSGRLGAGRTTDSVEQRRLRGDAAYDVKANRWNGDPGCIHYTAELENGVYLTHIPAVTDVRFEAVCSDGVIRVENNTGSLSASKRRGSSYSFDPVDLEPPALASSQLALVRDLIDCVHEDGIPLADETVALHGMELLMGVAQSHVEGGGPVALPLANRQMYIPSH